MQDFFIFLFLPNHHEKWKISPQKGTDLKAYMVLEKQLMIHEDTPIVR